MVDVKGKTVLEQEVVTNTKLELDSISGGIYFLKFINRENTLLARKKIVIH